MPIVPTPPDVYTLNMLSLLRYTAPPSTCGYLPDQRWSLEYEMVADLSAAEYELRLQEGWRRFGAMMFQPKCQGCSACQSIRVRVADFQPNRSQLRAWKRNIDDVEIRVGAPTVTRAKLELYDRFHAFQTEHKGWPDHAPKDPDSYRESFVHNPYFTEEWTFWIAGELIGVGYVDRLVKGASAIYFFHDPEYRDRSLGTFNVLCLIEECAQRGLPYLYLGYYVEGCSSLEYKANYRPNEARHADGIWRDFR